MKKLQIIGAVLLAMAAACAGGAVPSGGGNTLPQANSKRASANTTGQHVTALSFEIAGGGGLPLGQTLHVTLQAVNGNTPIVGTYDNPIILSAKHLTMSPNPVKNSTQARDIAVTWKNGFGGNITTDTITASVDGVSTPGLFHPQSGFAYYIVGNNPSTDVDAFQMALGPDGNIYYGTDNGITGLDGAVGQLNVSTGTAREIELHTVTYGVFFSHDGALWIAGGPSGNIFRLPPGQFSANALQTIAVPTPSGGGAFRPRAFTEDANNNLWFSDLSGHRLLSIPQAGPFLSSSIVAHSMPNGPAGTSGSPASIQGLSYGNDGKIYALDQNNGVVDRVDPASGQTLMQTLMPQQVTLGTGDSAFPRFVTHNAAGRMYFSYIGTFGTTSPTPTPGIDQFTPGSAPTISTVPIVSAAVGWGGTFPDSIDANGSLVYYADLDGALGVINTSTNSYRLIPTQSVVDDYLALQQNSNGYHSPNGVAALPDGTAWFSCYDGTTPLLPLCVGHAVYHKGVKIPWSLFPGNINLVGKTKGTYVTMYAGATFAEDFGIMEAPTDNSGPFQVTFPSGSSSCSISHVKGHNFLVTGTTPGTCHILVSDKQHNVAALNITVQQPPPGAFARRAPVRR